MNFIKKHLKNERGLTLIELLAVVVILGIIAAIAIPSIGSLINNSKKDAHIANGQQMVSAARTAVAAGEDASTGEFTLAELEKIGYLENVKNPSGEGYSKTGSIVSITKGTGENKNKFTYTVTLMDNGKGEAAKKYIDDKDPSTLKRDDISL
ncbi:prepilin-type N-terminal cleavage/methylation domain-containing protein [Peribacillus sp. NPDC097675]|uniref:prepilin-type N-terminal cleavage/methylation domain-containing protein n=1 Tax=Peribacillus sp. NPDC097675 TaxID=3390618 RepID=UPI003D03D518